MIMKDLRKLHRNNNILKGMCIIISCHTVFARFFGLLHCYFATIKDLLL